jgi:hypothetical protein
MNNIMWNTCGTRKAKWQANDKNASYQGMGCWWGCTRLASTPTIWAIDSSSSKVPIGVGYRLCSPFLIVVKFAKVLVDEAFNSFCRLILSLAGSTKTTFANMVMKVGVRDMCQL